VQANLLGVFMFKRIQRIDDVRPFVEHKKEIRFARQPNGAQIGCYMFMDSHTFDSPEALECRGIAFDEQGRIVSRPLHKFFNVGEKEHTSLKRLAARDDLVAVYEKLDGSMIATAWLNDTLHWRSKKSFSSDVVQLTQALVATPEFAPVAQFAAEVAQQGWTAIFELMHPQARIVVPVERPSLRLLHVRDNVTGAYLLLDPGHPVWELVARHGVELAPRHALHDLETIVASLDDMREREGYVLQFADGDMVKLKCPWYQRLHRSITFLRERDIAQAALAEELDDIKASLAEADVDLEPVNAVEARLKSRLLALVDEVEAVLSQDRHLGRKDFALRHQNHPLFGLLMAGYLGKEIPYADWYAKNRLKAEFGLEVLVSGALAEALEG
jgi:RNA ligase